jgi:hypothetical protein
MSEPLNEKQLTKYINKALESNTIGKKKKQKNFDD